MNLQPKRCPECGAVAWRGWPVTHRHRPPCKYDRTNPNTWSNDEK